MEYVRMKRIFIDLFDTFMVSLIVYCNFKKGGCQEEIINTGKLKGNVERWMSEKTVEVF